jgi:hypothetical protein
VGAFLTGGSPDALVSTGWGRCGRGCCAALAACIVPDALRAFGGHDQHNVIRAACLFTKDIKLLMLYK